MTIIIKRPLTPGQRFHVANKPILTVSVLKKGYRSSKKGQAGATPMGELLQEDVVAGTLDYIVKSILNEIN